MKQPPPSFGQGPTKGFGESASSLFADADGLAPALDKVGGFNREKEGATPPPELPPKKSSLASIFEEDLAEERAERERAEKEVKEMEMSAKERAKEKRRIAKEAAKQAKEQQKAAKLAEKEATKEMERMAKELAAAKEKEKREKDSAVREDRESVFEKEPVFSLDKKDKDGLGFNPLEKKGKELPSGFNPDNKDWESGFNPDKKPLASLFEKELADEQEEKETARKELESGFNPAKKPTTTLFETDLTEGKDKEKKEPKISGVSKDTADEDNEDSEYHSKKEELLSIYKELKEENTVNEMRECVRLLQTPYFEHRGRKFTGRYVMELVEELTKEYFPNYLEHNCFKAVDFLSGLGWVVRGLFLLDLRFHKKYNPVKNPGVYKSQLLKVIPEKFHPMVDQCLKDLKQKKMLKEFHHENGYFKVEHLFVLTPHGRRVMKEEHLYPPVKSSEKKGISLVSAVPTTFSNITITTSTMAPNATQNNAPTPAPPPAPPPPPPPPPAPAPVDSKNAAPAPAK